MSRKEQNSPQKDRETSEYKKHSVEYDIYEDLSRVLEKVKYELEHGKQRKPKFEEYVPKPFGRSS